MKRNLVGKILGKIKIFVQDFVPIRTALRARNLVDATRFWVHGCEPGRVSDGSRLALCRTLSIECPSSIFFWPVYFVIPVPFSLSFFLCLCVFLLLSLELGRCSSDLFLSSRPRTRYRIGNQVVYYWVWLRPDRLMWRKQQQQQRIWSWNGLQSKISQK